MATTKTPKTARPYARRNSGMAYRHRTDITLSPIVAEAAVLHARELGCSVTEYFRVAVAAFFKSTLVDPPEPLQVRCLHCGAKIKSPSHSSRWKRVRTSVRFDDQTRQLIGGLADDYFAGNWSRSFEAAVRHYLGDRNPPEEGYGKIPGIKLSPGRPKKGEERIKIPAGRPTESVEGFVKKHGGKL